MDAELIPIFVLVAVVVAELLLSGRFNRFYFTVGLPIFRREASCSPGVNSPPTTAQLEAATTGGALPGMVFRGLGNSEYAFREAAFGGLLKLTYTPLMHGLLTFDREHRRVRVVGLVNWFPVAFLWAFVLLTADFSPSEAGDPGYFVAFACGLVLFIYAIQFRRFSQVADRAAALWSKAAANPARNPLVVDESALHRPVNAIKTLWKVMVACAIAVPLLGIALMLIGTFTEEWTCEEQGSDWKCVGGRECQEASNKRFDGHRRTMRCKRTDWPMIPIEKVGELLND